MVNRKQIQAIVGGVIALYLATWLFVILYFHAIVSTTHDSSNTNNSQDQDQTIEQRSLGRESISKKNNSNNAVENPWYGWQPEISSSMECSWRECMKEKHTCNTCRDSKLDMAVAGDASIDPGKDWVPDVTMLHRMFLDGQDSNGNPWPPSLDDELCEDIGSFGGKADGNKQLIDLVPIKGARFAKTPGKNDKVLCMVYTMEENHATNIRAMRETWASGCDGFLAFSTKTDARIPAISIEHDGREEYNNMWQKSRSMWKFVGKHYQADFDWFYIGGEDLLVIPQNLKNYLGTHDPNKGYFLGRRFKGGGSGTYFNSGGAGYALSRASLQCIMEHFEEPVCRPDTHTPMEDVMIAQCLEKACNISIFDTRDEQKRERFHPFAPQLHYVWQHPKPPNHDWYEDYNKEWGIGLGKDCCAPDSVSFHYIKKPAMVRHLFHYLHNCNRNI
ncbi:unnamed protein product [Cylindrotheca closterium]|uniref:N-acetylgalactosaminide beta-1,3-galactosyltransferase n=1 Tax=Cylindrotheca closterium TaxID=2856 RepID=A0AAD2GBL4_9STRA|nr:unnamed protein product [Cylindrotheca closterium]